MNHLLQAAIAVIAITNPIGAAPVFTGITSDLTGAQRRGAALRASIAVFVILAVSALAGARILNVFGVSVPAFQAGGGLVVVLMGLEMMRGRRTRMQHRQPVEPDDEHEDSLYVPFAMPLIAGPGAITTVMTLASKDTAWNSIGTVVIAIAIAALALLVVLLGAGWLQDRISKQAHRVFMQFMGLILVAIGAQLVLSGVQRFQIVAPTP